MSSHREAPAISQDPVADNADVYAFVSPDDPSTVTILSNFVPLQGPAGGPKLFEFGYDALAAAAVHQLPTGETVFAGQRNDGFFVDLGSVFDLAALRPFQSLHLISTPDAPGIDPLKDLNIHTIAIKVPISMLTRDGSSPSDPMSAVSVLGVWSGASRRKVQVRGDHGNGTRGSGPWVQVSRLGNPLFNEVIVHIGDKDRWNAVDPIEDDEFEEYVNQPELAKFLPALYPGVFPNLASYAKNRADLHAILLTGIPTGVVDGFQNFTTTKPSDMLRLNVAIPPTTSNPNALGVVGGDLAGFPNGRRVFDDVVSIELKAVAGATIPLVDPSYTVDAAVGAVSSYLTPGVDRYQSTFPYL